LAIIIRFPCRCSEASSASPSPLRRTTKRSAPAIEKAIPAARRGESSSIPTKAATAQVNTGIVVTINPASITEERLIPSMNRSWLTATPRGASQRRRRNAARPTITRRPWRRSARPPSTTVPVAMRHTTTARGA
jgi:hypothetical protein